MSAPKPERGQVWRQTDLQHVKRFVVINGSDRNGHYKIKEVVRTSRGWRKAQNARNGIAHLSRFVGPEAGYELYQGEQS